VNNSEKTIPFYLIFCLLLWLFIGTLLSLELIINVMKTLPYLRVSSGFVFTVALWLVFASLVLIKFVRFARHLFVMGLWLLTVMSAPGVYVLIQFLERQGVAFSTGGIIYLVVYILMLVVVVYSSTALNRGGMSPRQIVFARAPMLFVSTMSFVLIAAMTVFYIPIPLQQCNGEDLYRFKLGIYACDLERREQKGTVRVRGCYKSIISFKQNKFIYFRLKPLSDNRCSKH